MIKQLAIFWGLGILLFVSCKKPETALFQLLPPAHTGIDFNNQLAEGDSLNILNYVYYYNGGGVGIGDFNKDGLEDIFFAGNELSSRLFLNKGDLKFEDATAAAGVTTKSWCTGVAVADVNADGWLDIYVCTAGHPEASQRKNLLFINQGQADIPVFEEMAAQYGLADTAYSTHAAFFDYDRDGDLDLYVLNHANERATLNTPLPKKINGEASSNDHFYKNNGDQTFTEISKEAGITIEGYGLGLAISDFNRDGWPDVYVSNDFIYNDLLYINQQGKGFSNQIADYFQHQTYNGMGCDAADFNNDGLVDLVEMDMLPETNLGQKMMAGSMTWDKWRLIEQAGYESQYMRNSLQSSVRSPQSSVSSFGRSEHPEFTSGIHSLDSRIERSEHPEFTSEPQSPVAYSEIGQLAGVDATDWSWAPLFADFDNDGRKDLFISNGYLRDITDRDFIDYSNNAAMFKSQEQANRELLPAIRKQKGKRLPNRIFQNRGDLTFEPKFDAWGMNQPSCSNGAAYADLDNDGDLDLVVNNINEPAFVYKNKSDKLLNNNYLAINFKGLAQNTNGIGATVTLKLKDGKLRYAELQPSRGFMSSVSNTLHVGLGQDSIVELVIVKWANGNMQTLKNIRANQSIMLKETDAAPFPFSLNPINQPFYVAHPAEIQGIEFIHQELPFNDFQYQALLPHGFSENGPPIAVGDLDGNGTTDFYVGGGKDQSGCLFYQNKNGHFSKRELSESAPYEDTDAKIFDADGDGHNDLLVLSGSHEYGPESEFYQSRLYLNDGKGNLKWAKNALPKMSSPAACAAIGDYDVDGDFDLFIGGSAIPGAYPLPGRSYLLRNENGHFTDATATAKALEKVGIVNAAAWADLDKNGAVDLVLVGEWMPITVFKNENGQLREATSEFGLAGSSGWWNSLAFNDLNGDGYVDLVAGNQGLNTKFQASAQQPLTIYADDFDKNGSVDGILCRFIEGKEKPVHHRDELMAQINGLEKKFPRYALYASASVQEIFGKKALAAAYKRNCRQLESAVFINQGGKSFSSKPLPMPAQFSSIHALAFADANQDGHLDLIMAGNSYAVNVSIGQQDASIGLLLLGDGQGGFVATSAAASGIFIKGAVQSLAFVNDDLLLVGVNGRALQFFKKQANKPADSLGESVSKIGF